MDVANTAISNLLKLNNDDAGIALTRLQAANANIPPPTDTTTATSLDEDTDILEPSCSRILQKTVPTHNQQKQQTTTKKMQTTVVSIPTNSGLQTGQTRQTTHLQHTTQLLTNASVAANNDLQTTATTITMNSFKQQKNDSELKMQFDNAMEIDSNDNNNESIDINVKEINVNNTVNESLMNGKNTMIADDGNESPTNSKNIIANKEHEPIENNGNETTANNESEMAANNSNAIIANNSNSNERNANDENTIINSKNRINANDQNVIVNDGNATNANNENKNRSTAKNGNNSNKMTIGDINDQNVIVNDGNETNANNENENRLIVKNGNNSNQTTIGDMNDISVITTNQNSNNRILHASTHFTTPQEQYYYETTLLRGNPTAQILYGDLAPGLHRQWGRYAVNDNFYSKATADKHELDHLEYYNNDCRHVDHNIDNCNKCALPKHYLDDNELLANAALIRDQQKHLQDFDFLTRCKLCVVLGLRPPQPTSNDIQHYDKMAQEIMRQPVQSTSNRINSRTYSPPYHQRDLTTNQQPRIRRSGARATSLPTAPLPLPNGAPLLYRTQQTMFNSKWTQNCPNLENSISASIHRRNSGLSQISLVLHAASRLQSYKSLGRHFSAGIIEYINIGYEYQYFRYLD